MSMTASPVNFLFLLLLVCIAGWVIFMFAASLLAWALSRIMGATIGFRVAGCNCVRDATIKFKKGAIESVSVGEFKLSLRKSLVKLGFGFISRDPKLHLLISDLEVILRQSQEKDTMNRIQKSNSYSRGMWMILANVARFLSLSITDLVVKLPKATTEVKDLSLELFKTGGSNPVLNVKLHLSPLFVRLGESWTDIDHSGSTDADREYAPFLCEELSVMCEFGHAREMGIRIKHVDVTAGEVIVNFNENLFSKTMQESSNTEMSRHLPSVNSSQRSVRNKKSIFSPKEKELYLFPEKVSFGLPKLDLRFFSQSHGFLVENHVMGIAIRSYKSMTSVEPGESASHIDVQLEFSEIHLFRKDDVSVLEIVKGAILASIDIPLQLPTPVRAEIDIRLGGTKFNVIVSRLLPFLHLKKLRKKKITSQKGNLFSEDSQIDGVKSIMWTCNISAPEMAAVLYSVKGSPLYHAYSQSSHFFANNIANKGMQINGEFGELDLYMADEDHDCFKESLYGIVANSGSLLHLSRVSLDWGFDEVSSCDISDYARQQSMVLVDITGVRINLNFQHIDSLVTSIASFHMLLQNARPDKLPLSKKSGLSSRKITAGKQILKLNIEQCSVVFSGEVSVENSVVLDPKHINYGSQGGEVIVSVLDDGRPRQAHITSTLPDNSTSLKISISLHISLMRACVYDDKQSVQFEFERSRLFYMECSQNEAPINKITLFDIHNAKIVRRVSANNEMPVCSLFSATDISTRWEPDSHLALYELFLRFKFLLQNQKNFNSVVVEASHKEKLGMGIDHAMKNISGNEKHKKKASVFAVDIEMLRLSAEVADGVEVLIHVQSIFSENAKIGILLEGLNISFNACSVFKSTRIQISRLPVFPDNSFDLNGSVMWDWVIQGPDVHICMPYRLELRAIDDAIEDTFRALKLIIANKRNNFFPVKRKNSKKAKVNHSAFGSIRFNIRVLTAEIEEEPIQGWLDEHHKLIKSEVCERNARFKFLDLFTLEKVSKSGDEQKEFGIANRFQFDGIDIDIHDVSSVEKLREEIHKKTFLSYYSKCQRIKYSEGSGSCVTGFQSGFKPSNNRASLVAIHATELDVTLTAIDKGTDGMIEFIKKLDAIALENDIPFSRLYGKDMVLNVGSLVAQLRDYSLPLFSGAVGKCEGRIVFAQQATCFQPQMEQDVFIGKWRKVLMLRSVSGTTPPMKMYSDLPISFQKGEISFGVGFEPAFADISYAFTVALRRANLSARKCELNRTCACVPVALKKEGTLLLGSETAKKERSLPWWDNVRYYIHGKIQLQFERTRWNVLATTDPYETLDKLQITSGYMDIEQRDGHLSFLANEFKMFVSSLENLIHKCSLNVPAAVSVPFLESPCFSLKISMDWECESGNSLNHYLHALPADGKPKMKVYDPFRSTSLSLRWNFELKPFLPASDKQDSLYGTAEGSLHGTHYRKTQNSCQDFLGDSPRMNLGAYDLVWILRFWSLNYNPPHKLRSFSRWRRFGTPRPARSGNLSLDKVMTEFFLRLDSMPACIKHMTLGEDDPAKSMTFTMTKLKYELCYSRGKQRYTFDCKRDPLDLVYQGLDLYLLKAHLHRDFCRKHQDGQSGGKDLPLSVPSRANNECGNSNIGCFEVHLDDGFLLSSDYFTIRKQAPKADPARLLAWQDTGRTKTEMTYVRSEFENGSESDQTRSDPSDDDGYNVVIADNCKRVFVYGLKLLWTIENRDAVWSWVGSISKAFEPPKPSPSWQYAQRKLIEGKHMHGVPQDLQDDSSIRQTVSSQESQGPSFHPAETVGLHSSGSPFHKIEAKDEPNEDEEGVLNFMVNVIEPQFNLHSEEANGRFLLAAASGRVLARSFHSVVHVGHEMIEKTLGTSGMKITDYEPEMTWKRAEYSVMLEHVQSHVAPTDVDPGAGLQWLAEIPSSPKVKRSGSLLEKVFLPCKMYFRYTRHKGASADLKVKPLKELTFNSPNITAIMTSRQFQVMLDVLSNLLFARLPKPRKNSLSFPADDDEDAEEADEVVPDGVEEVELAKIKLEQRERERKLLLCDIRTILASEENSDILLSPERESQMWMVTSEKSILVHSLKKEFVNIQKSRKAASVALRRALHNAAQSRLLEKEKNKSPSYAMRISVRINKVVWSMLADGKSFAEAEINNMVCDFDRDYKDIDIAKFTTQSFEVRNCLPNAKSDMLLAPWNAPPEWGKYVMLRVDSKQAAPKDGSSALELFQVEIHPLKIHLTEVMYRMMWEYFFPEEEQDSLRRQEVWKVSTTAGSRRSRKIVMNVDVSFSHSTAKDMEACSSTAGTISSLGHSETSYVSNLQSQKAVGCDVAPTICRTSSFDRTWEENISEAVPNETLYARQSSSKSGHINSSTEHPCSVTEDNQKLKQNTKAAKVGRLTHEEKKVGKLLDDKRSRSRKMMEFRNIKISQVELLVTYEGSRFAVNDLRLLMDTFHRVDFVGTWRRLFSRVKKHIIWGVLKSVTGMQGKKFKDKIQSHREANMRAVPNIDLEFSDSDGDQPGKNDQYPMSWLKRPNDGAGDGFVTSITGLFSYQRDKAKSFLRTMKGGVSNGDGSESDAPSKFARQLTVLKEARKQSGRRTKKFRSRGLKASGSTSQQRVSLPSSARETPYQSDYSGASSPFEDLHDQ